MPSSKFEANPMLSLQVRHAFFSLFLLASLCLNDYLRSHVIIDFLANRLVFVNTVTFSTLNHGTYVGVWFREDALYVCKFRVQYVADYLNKSVTQFKMFALV